MRLKKWKGVAIIEFAIVLPVLLLILFGTVDFGIVIYNKEVVLNASRAGARYGVVAQNSVYPSTANIKSYITTTYTTNLVSFSSATPSPTITVTSSGSPPATGDKLTVTVTYAYSYILINHLVGLQSPVNISATTVMEYE